MSPTVAGLRPRSVAIDDSRRVGANVVATMVNVAMPNHRHPLLNSGNSRL
jgi:hypothetical protein